MVIHIVPISGDHHSFVPIHISIWCHFPSMQKTPFSVSYSTNLLVINSCSFCMSEKVIISTLFWKTFLQGVEIWVDRYFFFQCYEGSGPSWLPWSPSLLSFPSLFFCTKCVLFSDSF